MNTGWVALDWGTSNLRAWFLNADDEVIDTTVSDKGMGNLKPEEFEPHLLDLIKDWLPSAGPVQVIACGMVGARQGWMEAPYKAVPCAMPGLGDAVRVAELDPRLDVRILPGLKQNAPPDVMRGEETQIAGFLVRDPEFDGVLCMPGTHSKWAHVSAREVVSFRTFMTGELFALLSERSVLRHSVGTEGWDAPAFQEAVEDAMSAPHKTSARLFSIRADDLLNQSGAAISRARLSGMLIGIELAGAREYWLGREIALVGAPGLTKLYRDALEQQGASVQDPVEANLALDGLIAAMRSELA